MMPVNDDNPPNPLLADGYAQAAQQYWDAGWRGILPMPRGKKFPPPTNYTGYQALEPSWPDIQAWCEDKPDGNIALHLPDGVIGIDVDAYSGKTGGGTIAYAEHLWGTLPPTVRTTSRDDPTSGIRLYRVPPGSRLRTKIEFTDKGLGHIEIIQASHRYAVVWPSLHPDGGRYRWQDHHQTAVDIPQPDQLPELPDAWADALAVADDPTLEPVTPTPITLTDNPDDGIDLEVTTRLHQAIADLATAASRHDTTCAHVLALLRLQEQQCRGVPYALNRLKEAFTAEVVADGSRDTIGASLEFDRMITNQRGHQLIAATPTVLDITEVVRVNQEIRDTPQSTNEAHREEEPEPASSRPTTDIDIPDNEFWTARPFLTTIYEQAHYRLTSPWSVLGCCIARALAAIPPWITLPPVIGGKGSLNAFVAIVGHSGQGKGSSEAVAEHLVPLDPTIGEVPIGSGEGLAHSYVHRAGPKEKDDAETGGIVRDRIACLFSIPEVDTLTAVGGRQGATIMSKLRSAYSGEEIGFSYADPTKRLLVGKHRYRLTLILGVQAARARGLLDDSAGGTPQRFVWLPATDPAVGSVEGRDHPPIDYITNWGSYHRELDIPDIAKTVIRESHISRARGEGKALDGHTLFTREKVMVALCALDGRTTPDEWDWMLAGKIMAKSETVRSQITVELAEESKREAVARGESMGIAAAVRDEAADEWRIAKAAAAILRVLGRDGPSLASSDVLRKLSSKTRVAYWPAIERLIEQGHVSAEKVVHNGAEGFRITLSGGSR